ncbi:MAG: PQQ-dependent sugar dehydrogenase [Fuerstiella sp.]|nr:PQQ-dependent sugar dehydrogenase [Fuerstiella sp.]
MKQLSSIVFLLIATVGMAADIQETALNVSVERAFPEMSFDRPLIITHANDGTDRVFVAEQEGVIKVFPNDQEIEEAAIFLDIRKQVVYRDNKNEEGLLGFAFHPDYKKNGHFFLYYTTTDADLTSVVTRFTVSKDDPHKADSKSEVELMRISQPYWNHNGGTLAFGPDGLLYIALGDGGKGGDPHSHGQNLTTLLGSILRIDVDRQEEGKKYAVPSDNPFVGTMVSTNSRGDKQAPAVGEIYAYGFRNVWRLSFDKNTGDLWAADVGQSLWEEINIVEAGGNYGWNVRESKHWFRPDGNDNRSDLIDPIWEYHHDVGKSITGGAVYRGSRVPELQGKYVYADYVSGLLWALDYDRDEQRVTGNYSLTGKNQPVMSFGEDEAGDLYFSTPFGQLFRFRSGL